jgi:hypothetical protein
MQDDGFDCFFIFLKLRTLTCGEEMLKVNQAVTKGSFGNFRWQNN